MVVDALMHLCLRQALRPAKAAPPPRGRILPKVLAQLLRHPYFRAAPPKSCGREQFGTAYAERLRTLCQKAGGTDADALATATELTAATLLHAFTTVCAPHLPPAPTDLIAAGGGARNTFLMRRLRDPLRPPQRLHHHHRSSRHPHPGQGSRSLRPPRLAHLARPPRQPTHRHRSLRTQSSRAPQPRPQLLKHLLRLKAMLQLQTRRSSNVRRICRCTCRTEVSRR